MTNGLAQLAELARRTMEQRLTRTETGELRFTTPTTALPARVAVLRSTGIPTTDIVAQYPELTAVDVKIARIASLLVDDTLLLNVERLETEGHVELVQRLHELAALVAAQ